MVRGANTINGHQRRIQLSGPGPDDAFGVAEPQLRLLCPIENCRLHD
jgi:hypothetical protein